MKQVPMPTAPQIAAEWDVAAPTRERQVESGVDHSANEVLAPAILEALNFANVRRVIDIGCGTGWLTAKIGDIAGSVVGVDLSRVSITIANQHHRAENVQYCAVGVESFLDTHADTFTAAVANMTLSTAPDLHGILSAIAGLLEPGGVFVFSIPHPCFFPRYWSYAEEPWFNYLSEIAIRTRFHIQSETTNFETTHIHRPLEMYARSLSACRFSISSARELIGKGFDLPRFLVCQAHKTG